MRRIVSIAAVLFVAIAVTVASPVSAATLASEHTTEADFNAGTTTNFVVSGSGSDAQLELPTSASSDTVSTGIHDDQSTVNDNSKGGVVIETANSPVDNIVVEVSSDADVRSVYLETAGGTTLETVGLNGGTTASFSTTLDANTQYRVVADDNGSDYFPSEDPSLFDNNTVEGDGIDMVHGYLGGASFNEDSAWNVRSIDYDYDKTPDTANYTSTAHDASEVTEGFGNFTITDGTANVEWQAYDGNSWVTVASGSYTSTAEHVEALSGSYDQWRVQVDVSTNATGQVILDREGVRFDSDPPTLDPQSASPNNTTVTESPVELQINVSDPDFGTVQGDTVTLEWYHDGQLDGTTTVSSNGTATYNLSEFNSGSNNWHVNVSDDYGNQDTTAQGAFTFEAPGQLEIRDESSPTQLIDNAEVEIRFYFDERDDPLIVNRTATDGTVDMAGLPANEPFVVVAESSGYYPRRIYKESLMESQSIFLLNQSREAVEPSFELVDYSGRFPEEDTVMLIQRALTNESGTTDWRTVQGDFFGATGQFPAQLRYNERHRLVLINTQTDDRLVKGQYTPVSSNTQEVRVLSSGEIEVVSVDSVALIGPAIRSLSARPDTSFTAAIDAEAGVESWEVTATWENDTQSDVLYQNSGTGSADLQPALNLSNRGGGSLTVTVDYTLSNGETGTESATFAVREAYTNQYSLLSVLGSVDGLLPGQHVADATTMFALIFTLLGTAAVAASIQPGTEAVGLVAVAHLGGFWAIGWAPREMLFIAMVGWLAIAGLRRGV